jgi:hypothetical protein
MRVRAALGGLALAATAGWNLSNVGAVADGISRAYGVGLGVVGLFTTALFVTHALLQVPAGRLCDRTPGAAVGMINMFAALTILVGTPLVGLTFSLPGDGRIGFLVVAALWAATALAVPRFGARAA